MKGGHCNDDRSTSRWPSQALIWALFVLAAMLTFPHIGHLEFFNPFDVWDSDNSWIYAINYAVSEQLVFGKDLVFSYGPLAAFSLPLDLGSNVAISAAFQIATELIWLSSVFFLRLHFSRRVDFLLFVALSVLCGLPIGESVRLTERTGVLILSVANLLVLAHFEKKRVWLLMAGGLAAIALLLKFNIGVACLSMLFAWGVASVYQSPADNKMGALYFWGHGLLAFLLAFTALFTQFGGPPDAIPDFLKFSLHVASGYSSEMSLGESSRVLSVAIFTLLLLYASLAIYLLVKKSHSFSLIFWISPAIFLIYKSMVVRQGFVTNFFPNFLSIGAMVSLLILFGRSTAEHYLARLILISFVVLGMFFIAFVVPKRDVIGTQVSSFKALGEIVFDTRQKVRRGNSEVIAMSIGGLEQYFKLAPNAPIDVYPKLAAIAWRYNFKYLPRFSIQSYSAYRLQLDSRSADYYNSKDAPTFIIYGHDSIDGVHPQTVDPLTWQAIYRWYTPLGTSSEILRGGALLLQRLASPRIPLEPVELGQATAKSGMPITIPDMPGTLTLVSAKFKMNWLGRLFNLFYKVDRPIMRVTYADRSQIDYRLSPASAATGFNAGSLSRGLSEVKKLFLEGPSHEVREITFFGNPFFHDDIDLSLKAFSVTSDSNAMGPAMPSEHGAIQK